MSEPSEIFQREVGTWDAEIVIVPQPGAEPQPSKGVSVNRLIGPWLVTDFKNHTTGFEGVGIYGWDTAKKKYLGTWVDPMRRSLVVAEGTWDEKTRVMTYWNEIVVGERGVRWRETTEAVGDDSTIFSSFMPLPDGGGFEMLRIVYQRRLA